MTAGLWKGAVTFSMAALLAAQPVVAIAAPVAAQEESAQQGQPAQDADTPKADDKAEGAVEEEKANEKSVEPATEQQSAEEVAPQAKAVEEKPAADESSAAVAKGANDKTYASIQDAINAGESLVTLVANTTENIVIPAGKTVTLDLSGWTLTNVGGDTVVNEGTLVIKDSSANKTGAVDNVTHGKAAIWNKIGGVATLDGGTIKRSKEAGSTAKDNGGNSFYTIRNQGTLTINDGAVVESKLENGNLSAYSSVITNGFYDAEKENPDGKTAYLVINGGKVEGGLYIKNDSYGNLVVNGGEIKGSRAAVFNYGTAELNGGSFAVADDGQPVIWNRGLNDASDKGALTINKGVYTATGNQLAVMQDTSMGYGSVSINGGQITGPIKGKTQSSNGQLVDAADDVSVSGGSFNYQLPSSYLANGFELKGENGTFGVQPAEGNVAFVDGKAYTTLKEAVEKAGVGSTVKLCKSVAERVTVSKKLNFVSVAGVDFKGSLQFNKGSEGSTVTDMSFVVDAESEKAGVSGSINLSGTSDITIKDNTFSIPSRLWGVYGDGNPGTPSWQPNSIYIGQSSGVTVQGNTFKLGRTNEQVNGGGVEGDATVAVNIAGQSVNGITLDGNTMTVTDPATDATKDASVSFLIANGNENNDPKQFGITGLTVTNNKMAGISGQFNRFAGLSDVDSLTVTGNTLTNLTYGIGRSSWQGNHDELANVTVGGNTYTNVTLPFSSEDGALEAAGAQVKSTNGKTIKDFATLSEAVKAATEGETVTLLGDSAQDVTIDKAITVTGMNDAATYTGTMTVTAGATIQDLNFEKDTNSIVLNPGTDGAKILNNTFTSKMNDVEKQQANAIYALQGGVTNLTVENNTFNAEGKSTVGLNIQNTGVDTITVKGNTLNDKYGNASLVNAFGKGMDNGGTDWGIKNLVVTNNTINGMFSGTNGDPLQRTNCATIRNVSGVTFENNILNKVYTGLSYAVWPGYEHSESTGITVSGNTATDSLKLSNLMPGTTSDDVTYGDNTIVASKYTQTAPLASSSSGLAFAGWYADKDFTTFAKQGDTNVSAKWVPISDVVTFLGGSLSMDYKNADGSYDFTKTSLRFGYTVKAPSGAKVTGWNWSYGLAADKLTYSVTGENKTVLGDEYFRSNLLLTNAHASAYGSKVYSKLTVEYMTEDGTNAKLSDETRDKSVESVAEAINGSDKASPEEKTYAKGILAAMNPTK